MRTGKIARLSNPIRHQLNLRLADNPPAKSILLWLNNIHQVSPNSANQSPIKPNQTRDMKSTNRRGQTPPPYAAAAGAVA